MFDHRRAGDPPQRLSLRGAGRNWSTDRRSQGRASTSVAPSGGVGGVVLLNHLPSPVGTDPVHASV
jgi:hypothetical protein